MCGRNVLTGADPAWKSRRIPLVFLDESSVNIDLTRRYGRVIGKTRVHGHAPTEHTPRTNHSGFRAPERSDDAHHVYRRYNGAALFGIPEGYPHSDLA